MILEKPLLYSLDTPYSIYFKMVVHTRYITCLQAPFKLGTVPPLLQCCQTKRRCCLPSNYENLPAFRRPYDVYIRLDDKNVQKTMVLVVGGKSSSRNSGLRGGFLPALRDHMDIRILLMSAEIASNNKMCPPPPPGTGRIHQPQSGDCVCPKGRRPRSEGHAQPILQTMISGIPLIFGLGTRM